MPKPHPILVATIAAALAGCGTGGSPDPEGLMGKGEGASLLITFHRASGYTFAEHAFIEEVTIDGRQLRLVRSGGELVLTGEFQVTLSSQDAAQLRAAAARIDERDASILRGGTFPDGAAIRIDVNGLSFEESPTLTLSPDVLELSRRIIAVMDEAGLAVPRSNG